MLKAKPSAGEFDLVAKWRAWTHLALEDLGWMHLFHPFGCTSGPAGAGLQLGSYLQT
jgi:hypothetical protein